MIGPEELKQIGRTIEETEEERTGRAEARRKNEIIATARVVAEGWTSLSEMPPAIKALAEKAIDRQVDELVERVIESVVEKDTTGTFQEALKATEATLGRERGSLSLAEELKKTLRTRLEFIQRQGKMNDPKEMDTFVAGLEKVLGNKLRTLAEIRKVKKPPGAARGGQGEARS